MKAQITCPYPEPFYPGCLFVFDAAAPSGPGPPHSRGF